VIVDVLRPTADMAAGGSSTVPSGTLAAVTSDNSDATYVNLPDGSSYWTVRLEPHTPTANYQRHQVRARVRAQTNAGTANLPAGLGLADGTGTVVETAIIAVSSTLADYQTVWYTSPGFDLDRVTALSVMYAGGDLYNPASGATAMRTMEVYVDIDTRARPDYDAQVRDSAGVDRSGGTVSDTNQPDLYFGAVGYDGLPALDWQVSVADGTGDVFISSGSGTPPTSVPLSSGLVDGAYTATFSVQSTIRGTDAFEHEQVISFTVLNVIPPPSPPLLTVEAEGDGYRLTWANPGGQTWDNDYVVAEVWRDDCTGSARIAVLADALDGTYLDLAIPQLDSTTEMVDDECTEVAEECDLTYRVRYWGYVSTTVTIPASIPVGLILGWPSTAASIPSGWLRVTDYDGYFPRGSSGTGAPSTTGGSASHSHTTPAHTHTIASHQHTMPAATDTDNTSTTTDRFNGANTATVNQSHSHTLPLTSGFSSAVASGSTAAGTDTQTNSPPAREVIWIRSDGSAVVYPIGALGWATESVSGWTADSSSSGRFLKGAAAAGNGGAQTGGSTHGHAIDSHTHTSPSHDHPDGTTGLSGPASPTEANSGGNTPPWHGRHVHPVNIVGGTVGTIQTLSGGVTGTGTMEPLNRRLRVLRNTGNGAQTRIIGLYNGTVAALPSVLTLCNGSNGTPDMRGWFARDIGSNAVNSTGGAATHTHSTPVHSHGGVVTHSHTISVGISQTADHLRDTAGDLGNVPTVDHVHDSDDTGPVLAAVSDSGSGTTGSADHTPIYKEAHFVRLEGTVDGGALATPELKTSEYAEATVPALAFGDDLDRLSTAEGVSLSVATQRSSNFPRLVVDSVSLDGGVHTVSTSIRGEDLQLVIAVEGKDAIDELEELLSEDRVYWAPLGGTAGWFAPSGWTVDGPAPNVKVLSVTMVRQPWPTTVEPETLL